MEGLLYINKPEDWTSFDVVAKIRKAYGTKSVGHTGTLDPKATGVLIVMLGKACKANPYLVHDTKEYIAKLMLGKKYDTGDIWGKVIEEKEVPKITKQMLDEAILSMLGKSMQVPPMYSAVKKDGKKLYEYARENKVVEVEAREIEIFEMEVLDYDELIFRISCSSGTYIRTLMETLAEKIGTVGAMSALKRTRVGNITLANCMEIDAITEQMPEPHSVLEGLKERYPVIEIESDQMEKDIKNGKKIHLCCNDELVVMARNNQAVAMMEKCGEIYCTRRGLW